MTESTNLLEIVKVDATPKLSTRAFHRLQERVRDPRIRRALLSAVSIVRPRPSGAPDKSKLRQLETDGVTHFKQFLSGDLASEIRDSLARLPCFDPWNPSGGEFDWQSPPPGTHVGQIRLAPAVKELHALALNSEIVALAGAYFGARPCLDSIQAWWSFSGNQDAQEAEYFHRDNDGISFLKMFIYLTDVTELNGPHVYIRQSHRSRKLIARRRLSDQEVMREFPVSDCCTMTGGAGDAFLEDTYGIHKGQLPIQGRRLLLQFRYSIMETIFRSPVVVKGSEPGTIAATNLAEDR